MASIIRMPEVLANATEAVISTWEVAEGSTVAVGDLLAEIETEKAVVELAAEEAGVLARHLAVPGERVEVGAPIALLLARADEEYDLGALLGEDASTTDHPHGAPEGSADGRQAEGGPTADTAAAASGTRVFASPLARKMAKDAGVEIAGLTGSGPGGRIVRRDVERHLAGPRAAPPAAAVSAPRARSAPAGPAGAGAAAPAREAQPAPTPGAELIPHTPMRRAIARRLTESKTTVPHFYLVAECRVDALLDLRTRINETGTVRVSVNVLVLKAVAAAFVAVPEANVQWSPEGLLRLAEVDVATAVATDGGLATPVVRGVERLSLRDLTTTLGDLAERARAGRLRQDELEGGSTTVSNLGMFGTREFSAILNPPQATILAVGAALPAPVVVDGRVEAATVMRCTLSVDHRAIDGALAARWLQAFQAIVEEPLTMLL